MSEERKRKTALKTNDHTGDEEGDNKHKQASNVNPSTTLEDEEGNGDDQPPPRKLMRVEETATNTTLMNPHAAVRKEPVITFPYTLDEFQVKSIAALERGESCLVSAHTSAGKTTVAYYAIAKALKEQKRVIYTSPIKALSNQKFREFGGKFDSVGLMTGDTTIKPDSDCLVMTTEILRSMLYRGTEMMREVGCVVFDEVHYMRDKSRGVVWEETIIMLPEGCQYVFLSATIPNAQEFADWVEHIHPSLKCEVVYTEYRPTPLQHYLYPAGSDGIYQVVDVKRKFNEESFRKAMQSMTQREDGERGGAPKPRGKRGGQQQKPIFDIIRLVHDKNMTPVIVFSFAKSECERNATALSKLNLVNEEDDALIVETYKNAIESLGEEDRKLPAVEHLLPLLRRGIGIHHSGLLPILKEVVEILFQSNLVKVLFSTETFSMGLNMPAKTVIFTSVKKFDGEGRRYLTGGEYIQMSGRAGRRGLDKCGIVIAMIDEAVDEATMKSLATGNADKLNSSFHLTYNMILNLLRVEDVDPEYMMMRSFAQYQRERDRPKLETERSKIIAQIDGVQLGDDVTEIFEEYTFCKQNLEKMELEEAKFRSCPRYTKPFLQSGRVLKILRQSDKENFGWGICVGMDIKERTAIDEDDPAGYTVDVAVLCYKLDEASSAAPHYTACHVTEYTTATADIYILSFELQDVAKISRFKINMPATFSTDKGRGQAVQTLAKMYKQFKDEVPLLSSKELGIEDGGYDKLLDRIQRMRTQLEDNELNNTPSQTLIKNYEKFQEVAVLQARVSELDEQIRSVSQTVLKDELKCMMRVLRRLDYIDKDNLILRKGTVACEITTSDENEILLTELLFKGIFNDMETEMIVSLLSTLVNEQTMPDNFSLPQEFQTPLQSVKEVVGRIAKVSLESGVLPEKTGNKKGGTNEEDKVNPSLMEVTYKWAKGCKFIDLVSITTAYEGEIVRMMRRLEEMLRQLAGASKSAAIGSRDLHDKFMAGIELIKRGIVFASSLYL